MSHAEVGGIQIKMAQMYAKNVLRESFLKQTLEALQSALIALQGRIVILEQTNAWLAPKATIRKIKAVKFVLRATQVNLQTKMVCNFVKIALKMLLKQRVCQIVVVYLKVITHNGKIIHY